LQRISDNEYLEIGSGIPIESENLVEFYLLYSGPLHSDRSENSRIEKHAIRKVFHPQLRQLWMSNYNLREKAEGVGAIDVENWQESPNGFLFDRGITELARWNREGFSFLPLVTKKVALRCRLDILFLRNEERDYVLQGGDIDRRIATLFDGLRMAKERDDLPVGAKPDPQEVPMFCLLENDDLITEVHIKTGRLLHLPNKPVLEKHDVYLEIAVQLNTTRLAADSWVFE